MPPKSATAGKSPARRPRAAPRKPADPGPAPPLVNGNGTSGSVTGITGPFRFEPLRLSTTSPEPLDQRRVELFSIDDDSYTIPAEPPMSWALEYLHGVASGSEMLMAQATDTLLTQMLGEEAWKAFREYEYLKPKHFTWVMSVITQVTMGAVEEATPKGPGNS
jgi:hypothetical protein